MKQLTSRYPVLPGIKGLLGNEGGGEVGAQMLSQTYDQPLTATFIKKVVMQDEEAR